MLNTRRAAAVVVAGLLVAGAVAVFAELYPRETVTTVGYEDGVHVNVSKTATCPAGTYASGIVVHYGGTCRNQCDRDGGIIRRVELTCRVL